MAVEFTKYMIVKTVCSLDLRNFPILIVHVKN